MSTKLKPAPKKVAKSGHMVTIPDPRPSFPNLVASLLAVSRKEVEEKPAKKKRKN